MYFLTIIAWTVVVLFVAGVSITALGPRGPRDSTTWLARRAVRAAWSFALLLAISQWWTRDWVHAWWAVEIPLVCLLLCAGPFLAPTSSGDASGSERPGKRSLRLAPQWQMLAMLTALAIVPWVMQLAIPAPPSGRNVGRVSARLIELAAWGLGGALPEALVPITEADRARGVGHLPREVTVPAAALLAAAWIWIAFCVLLVARDRMAAGRAQRAFVWLAPLALVGLCLAASGRPSDAFGWFDPNLFWPIASQYSGGVWRSDPSILRSFGPVLLLALACAIVLAVGPRLAAAAKRRLPGNRQRFNGSARLSQNR